MLNQKDKIQLEERGISPEEFSRQINILAQGAEPAELVRPARIDDGILRLSRDKQDELEQLWKEKSKNLTAAKFVPASGAATRMFKNYFAYLSGQGDNRDTRLLFDNLDNFAFSRDLEKLPLTLPLGSDAEKLALLSFLLGDDGWNWAALPKGLLPFHRVDNCSITPFEEHLREGALCAVDGKAEVFFTVSPAHEALFRAKADEVIPALEKKYAVTYNIEYSFQSPSTDTPALNDKGEPFRKEDGSLLFRPGGHGSLIGNLNALDRDIVFLKNIDNVGTGSYRNLSARWFCIFGSLLIKARKELDRAEENLRLSPDEANHEAACRALKRWGGLDVCGREDTRMVLKRLNRPVRICGMVKNDGDTGGGPFWIIDGRGDCSLQIVESAQIDLDDPAVKEKTADITHFNPVFIACSPRDRKGHKIDLTEYVDRQAVFTVEKSLNGKPLRALEHPGLWNGSMAFWNTTFVEIPPECFNPVKSLPDLLGKAHSQE